jgi:small GTP-binding protein
MDILKINGAPYIKGTLERENIQNFLEKKIILEDDAPIYQFIDNSGVDGNSIHKIRVAREIVFNCEAHLKHKATDKVLLRPKKLSELINYLDENALKDYRLVLDFEDKDMLSEIIQQLLYLDVDIEVMLLSEESERKKMELFFERFDALKDTLDKAKSLIHHKKINLIIEEDRKNILKALSDIEKMLIEIHRKDLNVAIMALKKSGKSVLVNCFLGDEYAPTSIELQTFNICIYKKSKTKKISLNYQNKQIMFGSPAQVKHFVLDQFRNAQNNQTSTFILDDMEINYVTNEDSLCNYTIIDTPGPDMARSDHKKIAYKWIGKADVVLFIVDYTKYLTASEEEFFRDIKTVFEEHNKFYSFIVVVNKLDLMYLSEEKKSALRFLDFLKSKLKQMGYKGFIVLGVSALQYFYSQKVSQIQDCEGLQTDDGKKLREYLDNCLSLYQGKDEMTILSFIDNQIRNLLWFHGQKDATLKTLKEKSGVEQLIKYINYISIEKATIELLNHRIALIDQKLDEIENSFISSELGVLSKKKIELENKIDEITQFYGEICGTLTGEINLLQNADKIESDINLADKTLSRIINMHMEDILKYLTKVLRSLSNKEIIALQKGEQLKAISDMVFEIKKNLIEKNHAPVIGKYEKIINRDLSDKEKKLQEQNRIILSKLTEFNEYMKKEYTTGEMEVALPKLPASFCRFEFSPIVITLDYQYISSLVRERLARKRGFLGSLLTVLSLGRVKVKTGGYKFDDIKLRKGLFWARKNLENDVLQQVSEQNKKLFAHINMHLAGLDKNISEEIGKITGTYKTVFDNIKNDLKLVKERVETRMEFLKESEQGIEDFEDLWYKFRTEHLQKNSFTEI